MTLTSHASTLELGIIPSLVLYFKSFSDEHGGFSTLVDLYSEVQGCTTMRCLPRAVGCIRKSHRDLGQPQGQVCKSCSRLSSTRECLTQHHDSQGHSCSLCMAMELQRGLKAGSGSTPTWDDGNAKEMPAVGYTGPGANTRDDRIAKVWESVPFN